MELILAHLGRVGEAGDLRTPETTTWQRFDGPQTGTGGNRTFTTAIPSHATRGGWTGSASNLQACLRKDWLLSNRTPCGRSPPIASLAGKFILLVVVWKQRASMVLGGGRVSKLR